uniref:Vacuolar protein sorting-associated protein n=1 Tax=Brassica oleracea var. oleracea TaxID=109376 RepID=A0A0D3A6T5_BRAOL
MCAKVGVDPLASNKGFWAELLGIGDFYYELVCMLTRSLNGGSISLQELSSHLRQRRKKDREAVTEDDCLRAISKLKIFNRKKDSCCFPHRVQGFVTVEQVRRRLSWTSGRVIDARETLLEEGLAMIDNGIKDGKCQYWFPCVSSVYSFVGSDT